MAFPQGINFRSTVGYVTDGANEYCQTQPGTGGNYPTTTPQGNTVGWEGTAFNQVDKRDRSTTVDHRLAGLQWSTTTAIANYRIDLPATGSYSIRLAAGDASFSGSTQVELFDTTTSLGVLATGSYIAGSFLDAAGVTYTAANWPGSNALVAKTFASTICRVGVGSAAATTKAISHFYIEAAAGGGTNTAVNPGAGSLGITGYAPTVARTANQAIAPGAGSIGFTGYAPTISQPHAVTAGVGSLALTGYAPSITQGLTTSIAPGAGTLALTGYAPTIAQSAGTAIAPVTGTLTITGPAPTVTRTAAQDITPGAGSFALTGHAPSIFQGVPAADVGYSVAGMMTDAPINLTVIMSGSPINVQGPMSADPINVAATMSNGTTNLTGDFP